MTMSVLYISYDGLTDTLGESQILSYLTKLSQCNYKFYIVAAEKKRLFEAHQARISSICEEYNITWIPVTYHKSPPVISTLFDIIKISQACHEVCKSHNISILHCRGYIPAMIGRSIKKKLNIPYIFDMRGFWPDEKVESGAWSSYPLKIIYKYFKTKERQLFQDADRIISLTFTGKKEVKRIASVPGDLVGVIPTCVNFEIFPTFSDTVRDTVRNDLGIPLDSNVLVYSGSLGGNYKIDIPFSVFAAFQELHPESYFLILSRSGEEVVENYLIKNNLQSLLLRVRILSVEFNEVHRYLMASDVGLIFYGSGFSNLGRSPTKLGEYWASGLPAFTFEGIGDVSEIIHKYPGSGAVSKDNSKEQILKALRNLTHSTADRKTLRKFASDYYSLSKGVQFYKDLYDTLIND